jgi:hypothetical protein
MQPLVLGTFKPGEVRTYRFSVTFPDGGVADNEYRGSAANVQFDWTSTGQDAGQPTPSRPGGPGTTPVSDGPPPASNVSPPPGGQAPAPSPALLTVTGPHTQRPLRHKGVVAKVRCRIACTVTAIGQIAPRGGARSRRVIRLLPTRRRLRAGASVKLKLKLGRAALRATRRALSDHHGVAATISFNAKAAGANSRAKLTIRLRR